MAEPECTMVLEPQAGNTFTLSLTSPFAGRLVLNGVAFSDLKSVGGAVRASLERSGIGIRGLSKAPDADSMESALEDIRENGWLALSALTSDARFPDNPARLRNFLSDVLVRAPHTRSPVLLFESQVDLPIDLMPALQPDSGRFRPNSAHILYDQACTWFLGFQFVVQKIRYGESHSWDHGSELIHSREFVEGRRVTLAPYWHRGLADVNQVVRELTALGVFDVLSPLPDDNIIRLRDHRHAAELLVHGREPPDGPEGIVHIASHCDAHDSLPAPDHCLRLAGGKAWDRKELRVTVRSLKGGGAYVAKHGPLAVITACGAADVRYDSPVSIPDALLYAGFRSVVSPLVSVNVDPGYAVILFLYEALKRGMSLGAALVEARKQLLERHGHTLGLLHTCYGDTRLRLDEEVVALPHRDRMPV